MQENQILHLLNEHLKIVKKDFSSENIFGIFATEIREKNIESEVIIIPRFEDVCTSLESISKIWLLDNNGVINARDIRLTYDATKQGHTQTLNILYTDNVIINPTYEHLFNKLAKYNRDKIAAGARSGIPAAELKVAITKICRMAWNEQSKAIKFIKQLTDAEKLALKGIPNAIGDEGTLKQSKIASAVGVSRLTISNLIAKMQEYEVADVIYLGNKGTYIKLIDDTLLNIRGL